MIPLALAAFAAPAPLRRLRLWLDLWSEREALRRLPPERLADLGLPQAAAAREAARPFWDVPSGRG